MKRTDEDITAQLQAILDDFKVGGKGWKPEDVRKLLEEDFPEEENHYQSNKESQMPRGKPDIRDFAIGLIERTQNPVAPLAFDKCANGLEAVVKMVIPAADEAKSQAYGARLIKDFGADEINEIGGDPEMIIALCGMLKVALTHYTIESVDGYYGLGKRGKRELEVKDNQPKVTPTDAPMEVKPSDEPQSKG